MELIVMLAAGLYILSTVCACGLCYLLGMHCRSTQSRQMEPPEEPAVQDPAKILREWLYGGDER